MITSLLNILWRERRTLSRYEALVELVERASDGAIETSGRQLAEAWRWPEARVRRFLDELAGAGAIALERIRGTHNGRGRKITLVASAGCASPRRKLTQAVAQVLAQGKPVRQQRVTLPADASADASDSRMSLGLGFTPSLQDGSSHHPITPGAHRGDYDHEQKPEHLRYAEVLADALNLAQGSNALVDQETFRPVAAHHRGTLEAALAIRNAHVPLEFARRYVWQEAQRFKPTRKDPQIGSLAYLRKGMITDWLRSSARTDVQERRDRRGKAVVIADVIETLVPTTRRSP
jgi:hypothetical protein